MPGGPLAGVPGRFWVAIAALAAWLLVAWHLADGGGLTSLFPAMGKTLPATPTAALLAGGGRGAAHRPAGRQTALAAEPTHPFAASAASPLSRGTPSAGALGLLGLGLGLLGAAAGVRRLPPLRAKKEDYDNAQAWQYFLGNYQRPGKPKWMGGKQWAGYLPQKPDKIPPIYRSPNQDYDPPPRMPPIFNVIPMGDLETEEGSQRPLFPPKLLKATVLDNPFDDIVPREPSRPPPADEEKPKRKGRRDLSLVSFSDEVQEEEQEAAAADAPRIRSSHDVLSDDPRLLKETAYDEEKLRMNRERERAEAEKKAQLKQRVRAAAAKAGGGVDGNDEERPPERPPVPASGDGGRVKAEKDMTLSELSMKRTEEAAQEYQRLKTEMLRYKKAKRLEEEERRRREADPQLTALEERRLKYLSKKSPKTEKEQKTLQRMAMFKNMLSVTILRQQAEEKKQAALKRAQAESDEEEEEVDYNPRVSAQATTSKRKEEPSDNLGVRVEALLDAEDDDEEEEAGGWMRHEMKCEKKQAEEDDGYVVLDPLNGNAKSKAPARPQSANADQRKRPKLT